jgi:alkyl sulfatase BDS1-like metallo-beta-lactamase superfamily hydrolase
MNSTQFIILTAILTIVTGMSLDVVYADPTAAVTSAIEQAKAARQKAASVKGEWRDTAQLIQKALEAAGQGDDAKAKQLAAQAREQGELGYQQAVAQQHLGLPDYMR